MYRMVTDTLKRSGPPNLPTGVGMYRRHVWQMLKRRLDNLPTGVGMYRQRTIQFGPEYQSPHRRGDVPDPKTIEVKMGQISPQAWGCTGYG